MATVHLIFTAFTLISLTRGINYIYPSEWELQEYLLPEEMIGEHSAGIINNDYVYLFGGLHLNPFFGIDKVAQLPITKKTRPNSGYSKHQQEWDIIANMSLEDGFEQTWFVSSKGANLLSSDRNNIFITCEDSQNGQIWKFNTETFEFDVVSIMPIPVEDCCAISSQNRIYIFGGDPNDNVNVFNFTQIYDYINDEWMFGEDVPILNGIEQHVCENVNDEFIYLFGGLDGLVPNKNAYKYNIQTDEWNVIEDVFENVDEYKNGITFMGTNYIPNTQYILFVGGETREDPRRFLNNMVLFNTDNDEIESDVYLPRLNKPRGGAAYAISSKRKSKRKTVVKIYAIGGRIQETEELFTDTTEILRLEIISNLHY